MLTQLLRVSKHSLIYSVGAMAERGVGFLLIPLYTRYLTPEDYGILGMLLTVMATLLLFAPMGVDSGMIMSYHEGESREEKRKAVGTALATTAVGATILLALTMLLAPWLSRLFFSTEAYTLLFRLVALMLFFEALILVSLTLLRAQEKSVRYVAIALCRFLIGVGLNVLFIVGLGWGVKGIIVSGVITTGLLCLYLVPSVLRDTGFALSWRKLKGMMSFGLPIIPANMAGQVMGLSDRYFIQFMVGSAGLGLYSLGYRFGAVMAALIVTPFLAAWGPFFWAVAKEPNALEIYSRTTTYYLLIGMFVVLVLAVLAKEVIEIMATPPFREAYKVIGLIALSGLVQGTVTLFAAGLLLAKKTWWVPVATGAGAATNLGLNWLLIPAWGIMGAAMATVISISVVSAGMLLASRRYNVVKYEWVRMGKIAIVGVVIFGVSLSIDTGGGAITDAILKGMLLLTYPVLLWAARFWREDEVIKVKEWIRR